MKSSEINDMAPMEYKEFHNENGQPYCGLIKYCDDDQYSEAMSIIQSKKTGCADIIHIPLDTSCTHDIHVIPGYISWKEKSNDQRRDAR